MKKRRYDPYVKRTFGVAYKPLPPPPPQETYTVDPDSDHLYDCYGPYDDRSWNDD